MQDVALLGREGLHAVDAHLHRAFLYDEQAVERVPMAPAQLEAGLGDQLPDLLVALRLPAAHLQAQLHAGELKRLEALVVRAHVVDLLLRHLDRDGLVLVVEARGALAVLRHVEVVLVVRLVAQPLDAFLGHAHLLEQLAPDGAFLQPDELVRQVRRQMHDVALREDAFLPADFQLHGAAVDEERLGAALVLVVAHLVAGIEIERVEHLVVLERSVRLDVVLRMRAFPSVGLVEVEQARLAWHDMDVVQGELWFLGHGPIPSSSCGIAVGRGIPPYAQDREGEGRFERTGAAPAGRAARRLRRRPCSRGGT